MLKKKHKKGKKYKQNEKQKLWLQNSVELEEKLVCSIKNENEINNKKDTNLDQAHNKYLIQL